MTGPNRNNEMPRYRGGNSHRQDEYRGRVACYGILPAVDPARVCSVCCSVFMSIPFQIVDSYYRPICDECASALKLPVYKAIEAYRQSIRNYSGAVESDSGHVYRWQAGMKKGVHLNLHTKALIEAVAERAAVHKVAQLYYSSVGMAFPLILFTLDAESVPPEVYERIEADLNSLFLSAQQDDNYIEYFSMLMNGVRSFEPLLADDKVTYLDYETNHWLDEDLSQI